MNLKTTIQQLRTDNTKQKKKLNTAMKENEHIKQTIKDMINTERTELGKNDPQTTMEANTMNRTIHNKRLISKRPHPQKKLQHDNQK